MSLLTIVDVGVALRAYLVENDCPIPVVYGPEAKSTAFVPERIVLEHDTDAKDSFGNPRGLSVNAKHRYTATDAFKATIYVRSAVRGPKPFDHRARAKLVREVVVAGLEYVAAVNKNRQKPTGGGFITPPDLAESEQPNGAAYELKFTYELPIRAVTFVGEAQPEATLAGMTSRTDVGRTAGDANETLETSCGA